MVHVNSLFLKYVNMSQKKPLQNIGKQCNHPNQTWCWIKINFSMQAMQLCFTGSSKG